MKSKEEMLKEQMELRLKMYENVWQMGQNGDVGALSALMRINNPASFEEEWVKNRIKEDQKQYEKWRKQVDENHIEINMESVDIIKHENVYYVDAEFILKGNTKKYPEELFNIRAMVSSDFDSMALIRHGSEVRFYDSEIQEIVEKEQSELFLKLLKENKLRLLTGGKLT